MLILLGDGANGKSVFLKLLSALVGQNTSCIPVDQFSRKEARAELEGKLLNISSEMSSKAWRDTSHLKAIVAGDEIEARKLYENSYSFKPTARVVVATNNLPQVMDHSHGFFRRLIILKFNRKFSPAEQNRDLEQELLEELPGILVWAVVGQQTLLAQAAFTIPKSSEEYLARYQVESDDVLLFLDEEMESASTGDGILSKHLYALYQRWAKDSGLPSMDKYTFGKRLSRAGISSRHTRGGTAYALKMKTPAPVTTEPAEGSGDNIGETAPLPPTGTNTMITEGSTLQ